MILVYFGSIKRYNYEVDMIVFKYICKRLCQLIVILIKKIIHLDIKTIYFKQTPRNSYIIL